jgi:hypothetical protein
MVAEDTQKQFLWSKPVFKDRNEEGKKFLKNIIIKQSNTYTKDTKTL